MVLNGVKKSRNLGTPTNMLSLTQEWAAHQSKTEVEPTKFGSEKSQKN